MYTGRLYNFFYKDKEEVRNLPKVKRIGRRKPLIISILDKYYLISSSTGKLIKINNKLLNSSSFKEKDVIKYVTSFREELSHRKAKNFLSQKNIQRKSNKLREFDIKNIPKIKKNSTIAKINKNFSSEKTKKNLEFNVESALDNGFNINDFLYKRNSYSYKIQNKKSFFTTRSKFFKQNIKEISITNDNLSNNDNYKSNNISRTTTKIKLKIKPKININNFLKENFPKTSRDEDDKLEIDLAKVPLNSVGKNDLLEKLFPDEESLKVNENDTILLRGFKDQVFKERIKKKLKAKYKFFGEKNKTENKISKISLKNLIKFNRSSMIPQKKQLLNQKIYFERINNYNKKSEKLKVG